MLHFNRWKFYNKNYRNEIVLLNPPLPFSLYQNSPLAIYLRETGVITTVSYGGLDLSTVCRISTFSS